MRQRLCTVVMLCLLFLHRGEGEERRFSARTDGTIPIWLIAGPFDQPTVGFGSLKDGDAIGERDASPFEGKEENSTLVSDGKVQWVSRSVDTHGYLDLGGVVSWALPGDMPERVVFAKASYAFVVVECPAEREAVLLCGSNSQLRVFVNGERIYTYDGDRSAVPGTDTIRIHLHKGSNRLLLKVGNTHQNQWFHFFGGPGWGWGAYARLLNADFSPMTDPLFSIDVKGKPVQGNVISTFFFKNGLVGLLQRFDLVLTSHVAEMTDGTALVSGRVGRFEFPLRDIPFGSSRVQLYIPEVDRPQPVTVEIRLGTEIVTWSDTLRPEQKYELHLMNLSHTDIGYTHPQPVVSEIHNQTLDDAVSMCSEDPDFRWTLETLWQLREYEKARPRQAFQKVIDLMKAGKIAASPILTNPFTGWVSEEEMIRALDEAKRYASDYGLRFEGAVYDDVPGLAWFLPQVLSGNGVKFLACGLNEFFNDYSFQRTMPKAFWWEGSDGSRIVTYRNETYGEGSAYGLERDTMAIQQRAWERLLKLRRSGQDYSMVLLTSAVLDNGIVPKEQFRLAKIWNRQFAYPRFVFSTLDEFSRRFTGRFGKQLPVVRGDWTSAWDVLSQGEPARMIRERWAQTQILSAEKLAILGYLIESKREPYTSSIAEVYTNLLHFSGHGSGLEYGYGTPGENAITMQFREQYIRDAYYGTEALLERARTRLVRAEEEFAKEGIIVFNTLSWTRDVPLEVELKDSGSAQYTVAEFQSGGKVPSYRTGYRLKFVAPAVPSMGFKKFSLTSLGSSPAVRESPLLVIGPRTVENEFYRVTVDSVHGSITSLLDKRRGIELLDLQNSYGFGLPLRDKPYNSGPLTRLESSGVEVEIIDHRPASVGLEIRRPGQLFERTSYTLWGGVDRLEMTYALNLERLGATQEMEEYFVAFPLLGGEVRFHPETLGGLMTPETDRLPGIKHDGYSLRRCAVVTNGRASVTLASPDARVVFWRKSERADHPAMLFNLVNNFPRQWNRNEENKGVLEYRFNLSAQEGGLDPIRAVQQGWEFSTETPNAHTLLRTLPADTGFLTVTGGLLTAMRKTEGGIIYRLNNPDPNKSASVSISSPFFSGKAAYHVTFNDRIVGSLELRGESCTLTLKPNEVFSVLISDRIAR